MLVPSGRQQREKMNQEALASGRDLVASPCRPQGKLRKVVPETIGSLVRESDEFSFFDLPTQVFNRDRNMSEMDRTARCVYW